MQFVKMFLLVSTFMMSVRFPPDCSDGSPGGVFF